MMDMKILMLCMLLGVAVIDGYRVLMLPLQLRNRVKEHISVARALETRGNDVYMAVPQYFPYESLTRAAQIELIRYHQPDNNTLYTGEYHKMLATEINYQKNFRYFPYKAEEFMSVVATKMCNWMMQDNEFLHGIKFMNFDVALVDTHPSAPCNVIVPYHLSIRFVSMSSLYLPSAGNPSIASFVPALRTEYSDKMSFWQRLSNFMEHREANKVPNFSGALDTSLIYGYPPKRQSPVTSWAEVVAQASLFITLRDYLLEWPIPTMPHTIQLPGLTQQKGSPLPGQLDSYIYPSIEGTILISFGSTYDLIEMGLINRLFDAFRLRELRDYKILLRMHQDRQNEVMNTPGGMPPNVWIVNWVPQNDILANDKVRIYVSDCGNKGQYEALYHGVPMIGLPLYGDQAHNCIRMHKKGVGICMDTWSFTPEMFAHSVSLLTKRKEYRETVQAISTIMKDTPMPSQHAAYWIEYVAQFSGEHLRSAGSHLSGYTYWMVDLYIFLTLASVIGFFLIIVIVVVGLIMYNGGKFRQDPRRIKFN